MTGFSSKLGVFSCLLIAAYFLLSPLYALVNFDDFAASRVNFVRYVVVPGVLGLAFISIGLLGSRRIATLFGLYGLTSLFALFLFESFLVYRQIPVRLGMLGQLEQEQRQQVESSERLYRGFTLRQLNTLANTESLSTAIVAGFPGAEIVLCAPGTEMITYKADRYGFNNPDEVYDRPMDVMLLGDSFVEGFCLPHGKDLASQLRNHGVVTASMGIRGNGPLMELATLGRYGPRLRPRHVVMAFFEGNDWRNLDAELTDPWLRAALEADADYGSRERAADTIERAKHRLDDLDMDRVDVVDLITDTSMLRNFVALHNTAASLGLIYPRIAHERPEFAGALERAKALTESWGGRFSLLYIPRVDRFAGALASDAPFEPLRRIVLDAAEATGVHVIDLTEAMHRTDAPKRLYAPDSHFSEAGAEFAAKLVADALMPDTVACAVGVSQANAGCGTTLTASQRLP